MSVVNVLKVLAVYLCYDVREYRRMFFLISVSIKEMGNRGKTFVVFFVLE